MSKRFALIGTAGYVAPRHLKAIKDTNNILVATVDPSDSVGIIDQYFPNASFFTSFERFDRHLSKLKLAGKAVDYLSICSPNHLHDAHIRYGLRLGAHVICEKPLVLKPWNLDSLQKAEEESGKKVHTILQLRLIPDLIAIKEKIEAENKSEKYDVELSYITPRGNWYYTSWKGDIARSGGIVCNIGIHLFDLLLWLFGPVEESQVHALSHDRASGYLDLKKAKVRWFLSLNEKHLPEITKEKARPSYRNLKINGHELEFSKGFTELHTHSYNSILNGNGFGIEDARPSIELVHQINNQEISTPGNLRHPMNSFPQDPHPFSK